MFKATTTRCARMHRACLMRFGFCTGDTTICLNSHGPDRIADNWRRCLDAYCAGWTKWPLRFISWKTLSEDYHWHIEILPIVEKRSKSYSIKEVYFNAELPEQAAANLRALDPNS